MKLVNCGCGGEAIVHEQEYGEFEVYCPVCFITTDDYKTKDKAIEAWNRAMCGNKTGIRSPRMLEWLAQPLTK